MSSDKHVSIWVTKSMVAICQLAAANPHVPWAARSPQTSSGMPPGFRWDASIPRHHAARRFRRRVPRGCGCHEYLQVDRLRLSTAGRIKMEISARRIQLGAGPNF
jgi:hypothetical protein